MNDSRHSKAAARGNRRSFLARGSAAGATAVLASPAFAAAEMPNVRWRMPSTYPKSLVYIFGTMEAAVKRISELTEGRFQISLHQAGELVPALSVLDAVEKGTVQCGHSASYYYVGKDPAFGFHTAMPFGLNTRAQNAWLYHGGGEALCDEFFAQYGVMALPVGNTGAQMAGWYRKEIKTPEDLKGLKFRIGGLGGMVLQRVGVVPQQVAPGELYTSLEKGVIDAAEFVGPADDEKLGLQQVAKYYYYPGWWEGSASVCVFVNRKEWDALPAQYRAAFRTACVEANQSLTSHYDVENPKALRRLMANGAQLRGFPREVIQTCYEAAHDMYGEMSKSSAAFRKIYEPWSKFRAEQITWNQYCELPFDNLMSAQMRKKG